MEGGFYGGVDFAGGPCDEGGVKAGDLVLGGVGGGVGAVAGTAEEPMVVLLGAREGEVEEDVFLAPIEGFGQGGYSASEPPRL